MSRKQLYVDWETLNKLIQAKNQKKKAIVMPDNAWYEPAQQEIELPNAPAWAGDDLLGELQKVFEEEITNAKDKVASVSENQHPESVEAIRDGLNIFADKAEKTIVVLVVIDTQQPKNNEPRHISCPDGICFGGYVRDMAKDAYIVDCVDYVSLGTIPVAFKMNMPRTGGWATAVPMSDKVVEKLLPAYYKRVLKTTREKYPKPRYDLHYMQMLSCG